MNSDATLKYFDGNMARFNFTVKPDRET